MGVKSYRDLVVWQDGLNLVEVVYRTTAAFPREELYGLTSQMRRAASSIPCNIAEGQGRQTTKDFLHFLAIATGSLRELETQFFIAHRLGYLNEEKKCDCLGRTEQLARQLAALVNSLRRRLP
jgi:four helix bundle protein